MLQNYLSESEGALVSSAYRDLDLVQSRRQCVKSNAVVQAQDKITLRANYEE